MGRLRVVTLLVLALERWVGPAKASAQDPAGLARNILPSGQYGMPLAPADDQAILYDGLTPLFDNVTPADLITYFKSEALGPGTDGPLIEDDVPFAGVRILRDKFNVPHVYSETYEGGVLAAGWIAAKDRGLLLQQARYNGRAAIIDAPGLSAIELIAGLQDFRPSAQTEAVTAKQTQALKDAGKEGKAVLRDIDTFVKGINAYLEESGSTNAPWTRNDVYAVNAVKSSSSASAAATRPGARASSPACSSGSAPARARRSSTTFASSRTPVRSPRWTASSPTAASPRSRAAT